MTLGRKLVRLGLVHEDSADAFRAAALQMAPIKASFLDELHHTIKQRYRQAYAVAGEDKETAAGPGSSSTSSAGMEGFVMSNSGNGSGGSSHHHHHHPEKDYKPIFIKPQAKGNAPPPGERKSMLGLDKLAAVKRAERMMKEKLELQDGDGVVKREDDDLEEDEAGDGGVGFRKTKGSTGKTERSYRSRREPDTPSHPGGVNREAQRELDERERQRGRGGGVALHERERDRDRSDRSKDRHRNRDRDRDRDKDRDQRRRRSRSRSRSPPPPRPPEPEPTVVVLFLFLFFLQAPTEFEPGEERAATERTGPRPPPQGRLQQPKPGPRPRPRPGTPRDTASPAVAGRPGHGRGRVGGAREPPVGAPRRLQHPRGHPLGLPAGHALGLHLQPHQHRPFGSGLGGRGTPERAGRGPLRRQQEPPAGRRDAL